MHEVDLARGADCSEPLEREVAVESEDGLPPHEEESRLPQLEDAVVDQLHGGPERTADVSEERKYLRLAGGEVLGVLLLLLVVVEEALDRGSVVRVLAREDDFDAELEQVLANVSAAVVRRVVEQPVRVFSPVGPLLAQQLSQAREKHQHDVAVCVELC